LRIRELAIGDSRLRLLAHSKAKMTPAIEKRLGLFSILVLLGIGLLGIVIALVDLSGADSTSELWKQIKGTVSIIFLIFGILAMLLGLARVWSKYHRRLPHDHVYVRLGTSSIHGIGLFAITQIQKGTRIFYDDSEIVWFKKNSIDDLELTKEVAWLYKDFRVLKNGYYGCPKNFNLITPSWYQNHSDNPNTYWDDEYNLFALKDIEKDEELVIDYRTYSVNTFSNIIA
jgi:hypothetical protein